MRWSDVAFTGFSHGAQSAACFATVLRVYRAVSQSGPRDNTCGLGPGEGPVQRRRCRPSIRTAPSRTSRPGSTRRRPRRPSIASTRFTGGMDGQFGDIMFTMQRMNFVGDYVNLDDARPRALRRLAPLLLAQGRPQRLPERLPRRRHEHRVRRLAGERQPELLGPLRRLDRNAPRSGRDVRAVTIASNHGTGIRGLSSNGRLVSKGHEVLVGRPLCARAHRRMLVRKLPRLERGC